jgi:hypothetical protein
MMMSGWASTNILCSSLAYLNLFAASASTTGSGPPKNGSSLGSKNAKNVSSLGSKNAKISSFGQVPEPLHSLAAIDYFLPPAAEAEAAAEEEQPKARYLRLHQLHHSRHSHHLQHLRSERFPLS